MPLIKLPPKPSVKEQFRIRMSKDVLDNVDIYCKWQGVDRDYFIEQAVSKIFKKKDKEWIEYKSKLSSSP